MSLNPLQAYQAYRNTQQPTNSSSTYNYTPSGNYGSNPPPVVTSREMLANRNTIPTGPPPSSLQRGGGVLDSPIPSAASIAHFAPSGSIDVTGEKKPIQTNTEKPSFSAGTESYRSNTLDTLKQLTDA